MREKIICAAIWYKELPTQTYLPKNIKNGIVVCGYRHVNCIDVVKTLSELRTVRISPDGVGETIQGFLTNKNRFVDRKEAYQIAKDENQLNNEYRFEGILYSENLY